MRASPSFLKSKLYSRKEGGDIYGGSKVSGRVAYLSQAGTGSIPARERGHAPFTPILLARLERFVPTPAQKRGIAPCKRGHLINVACAMTQDRKETTVSRLRPCYICASSFSALDALEAGEMVFYENSVSSVLFISLRVPLMEKVGVAPDKKHHENGNDPRKEKGRLWAEYEQESTKQGT